MSRRKIECAVCGVPVTIQDRNRFLRLVRLDLKPVCKQCGKYVYAGGARVTEMPSEQGLTALGLRLKKTQKSRRGTLLETMPLGRCGVRVCDDPIAPSE